MIVHPDPKDDTPDGMMSPVYVKQLANPTVIEVPGLPKSEGPPPIKNNHGGEVLTRKRQISLADPTISAGAFRWLWEAAEHAALEHHRRYGEVLPHVSEAATEAVSALRRYAKANGMVDLKSKKIVKKTAEEPSPSRARTRAPITNTVSKSKKVVVKKKSGK